MNGTISRRDFIKTTALAASATPALFDAQLLRADEAASKAKHAFDLAPLARTHDLRLPDWGCYTNLYNGLCHVADRQEGLCFELSVFPGFFRRDVLVPNVKWVSGFHPWEAAPDLSYFAYRYGLQWKDQVYCDVSFSALDDHTRLIRAEFVNRTTAWHNTVLHYMAYLYPPRVRPYSDEISQRAQVTLPTGGIWVNAVDHAELRYAVPPPAANLIRSGWRRGEVRDQGFVCGSGIGAGFGRNAGDALIFKVKLRHALPDAMLVLRYRSKDKQTAVFELGGAVTGQLELPPSPDFNLVRIRMGRLDAGACEFAFTAKGSALPELDGFALVPASAADEVKFSPRRWQIVPKISDGPVPQSLLLKYDDLAHHYGIAWKHENAEVREFLNSELDRYFRRHVHNHVHKVLRGDEQGHFTNVFLRPIALPPNSRKVVYGLATSGSQAEVERTLRQTPIEETRLEAAYEKARNRRFRFDPSPKGRPHQFSQEMMAACALTNVVFPVYTRRTNVRTNVPGKWWDSLYTWDAGFIGLGFAELDLQRAVECLNTYTTPPGDPEAAFLHIGTPLPVQIFLFWELWNRTQSRELLEYFYPRLRQYHQFLAGRYGGSNTRRFKSNLLTTWSYFYNTGWDDYPPQKHMHAEKLAWNVAPVINTAIAIRTAKMLRVAAQALGEDADVAVYDEDIALWTDGIQQHAWDAESGYYSYVMHDRNLQPTGILRHPGGQNFNLGMDGVTPLIAGIGTPEQFAAQLRNLKSPQHLWTPIGISTVDQSAAYYRKDGYWNGAVWMPHQWFIWKSMLDWGAGDFAFQIAQTALDLWRNEVNESYHCFEHFLIESRRGAGWHQFGALSSPVLNWYAAYYVPGRLTTGFDVWVRDYVFGPANRSLTADLEISTSRAGKCHVIATLNPVGRYRAQWNGQRVPFKKLLPGVLQVELPTPAGRGRLRIS